MRILKNIKKYYSKTFNYIKFNKTNRKRFLFNLWNNDRKSLSKKIKNLRRVEKTSYIYIIIFY